MPVQEKKDSVTREENSKEYPCVFANQSINAAVKSNTFSANVSVADLLQNKDIKIVDDMRVNARWGLHKVIQRNIDKKRVDEIANNYLKNSGADLKFFPSITVVLLPKSVGEPISKFLQGDGFDKIDGIYCTKNYYDSNTFEPGFPIKLHWNKSKVEALVVDGQHRVSALRKYFEECGGEEAAKQAFVPVTFVVFENSEEADLIKCTRSLFIDVNNTPKLVPEQKLIFIDDRNLLRRITASILGAEYRNNGNRDLYQEMDEKENLALPWEQGKLNKFFFREHIDEGNGYFSLSHSGNYPWEISNLLTLHETLIKGIVFQYDSKTKDFRKACTILNSNFITNFEQASLGDESYNYTQTGISESIRSLSQDFGLNSAETKVIRKYLESKSVQVNEFKVNIDSCDTEEDQKNLISSLKTEFNKICSSDHVFDFNASDVDLILEGAIGNVVNVVSDLFNKLWFVTALFERLKNLESEFGTEVRQNIYRTIVFGHEEFFGDSGDVTALCNKALDDAGNGSEKAQETADLLIRICDEAGFSGNVLVSVVGQQALFEFIFSICDTDMDLQLSLDEPLSTINSLGKKNWFNRNKPISVECFGENVENFYLWTNLILKDEENAAFPSYKPSYGNAKKAASLLSLIHGKVCTRNEAFQAGLTKHFDVVAKSYGDALISRKMGTAAGIRKLHERVLELDSESRSELAIPSYATIVAQANDETLDKLPAAYKKALAQFVGADMLSKTLTLIAQDLRNTNV